MFKIKFSSNIEKVFSRWPEKVMTGLKAGLQQYLYTLEKQSKGFFGRPAALKVRTGRLRASIKTTKVQQVGQGKVEGYFGSNLIYAPVHEFGAKIAAKNSKYLMFKIGNNWKKVKEVNIQPRPFLKTAISNTQTIGKKIIQDAIIRELNK